MTTGLGWYLDTIGRVPLLTPAEEIELGTAVRAWLDHPAGPDAAPPGIRRHGQRARDRFIQSNLRLAVSYVNKRCHRLARSHGTDDLVQAANLGLITAVERFDPARGYRFSTYAYWWLRQSVNRWIDQHGRIISIPGSHSQHLGRLGRITRRLQSELNRNPTRQEIADELGVSMAVLDQISANGRPISSLDASTGDDDLELGDLVASYDRTPEEDEDLQERWRQAEQLRGLIACLTPADQQLLSLAWGLEGVELPRAELAQQEGLSVRALDTKLERLQRDLASRSVQLVLVAVQRIVPSPKPRRRRRRNHGGVFQLVLLSLNASRSSSSAVA